MAILSVVSPALGLIGSLVKHIVSDSKHALAGFCLDLFGTVLPGGFAKDLAVGVVADAVEASSLHSAVDHVVPMNEVALKCDVCGTWSRFHVRNDGSTKCKRCFERGLDAQVHFSDRIFVMQRGIYQVRSNLSAMQREAEGRGFRRADAGGSFLRLP
jgi:hypothetical protein